MKKQLITDRVDRITKMTPEYSKAILPAPKSVKIELSPRCNFRCKFCSLNTRTSQPTVDMDFDVYKKIVKDLRESGVEELGVFYIGESFMNPDLLVKAIDYAKNEVGFPYVFITTNGSLANPSVVNRCMEAGLDSLKWSLNACDENQFEEIMLVNGKLFERIFKNIKDAYQVRMDGKYSCGLYASSIKYDGEQQSKMEKLLFDKVLPYVDQHYWLPLYTMGSFEVAREAELGYKPTAGNQGRFDALREPLPCWTIFTEGHVIASGELTACGFDAKADFVMGDLKTENFMDAWNSEKFVELRKRHLKKNIDGTICEKCIAY